MRRECGSQRTGTKEKRTDPQDAPLPWMSPSVPAVSISGAQITEKKTRAAWIVDRSVFRSDTMAEIATGMLLAS